MIIESPFNLIYSVFPFYETEIRRTPDGASHDPILVTDLNS